MLDRLAPLKGPFADRHLRYKQICLFLFGFHGPPPLRGGGKGDCRPATSWAWGTRGQGVGGQIREGGKKDKEKGWKKLLPPRAGSLGIVIRAGSAANEDNGIKVFGSLRNPVYKSWSLIWSWQYRRRWKEGGGRKHDWAEKRMYKFRASIVFRQTSDVPKIIFEIEFINDISSKDVATIGNFGRSVPVSG